MRTFVFFTSCGESKSGLKLLDKFCCRWYRQIYGVLAYLTTPVFIVLNVVAFDINVILVQLKILCHANLERYCFLCFGEKRLLLYCAVILRDMFKTN